MQQVDFPPLGRRVSRLGLGCARLDGRVGARRSAKLLETALDLGITYFDVAASYGTAEEALGQVIGGSKEVVIATKVGPPPVPYNATNMRLKQLVKPTLDRFRALKVWLRQQTTPSGPRGVRPRYDFTHEAIERSLERSRQRLQREHIDVFLAHEPHADDLNEEVATSFQGLVDAGAIGAFGVGIDARNHRWSPFGSVWQSGWPGEKVSAYRQDVAYTFHGVLRYGVAEHGSDGRSPTPTQLLREALSLCPGTPLLVSASTPSRLRELVEIANEVE